MPSTRIPGSKSIATACRNCRGVAGQQRKRAAPPQRAKQCRGRQGHQYVSFWSHVSANGLLKFPSRRQVSKALFPALRGRSGQKAAWLGIVPRNPALGKQNLPALPDAEIRACKDDGANSDAQLAKLLDSVRRSGSAKAV